MILDFLNSINMLFDLLIYPSTSPYARVLIPKLQFVVQLMSSDLIGTNIGTKLLGIATVHRNAAPVL